jgi:hypothetical protein
MGRIAAIALTISIFAGMSFGCSKQGPADGKSAATSTSQPPSDPIARVAYDFLDAVVRGDDQRASACLTPKAIERLIEGNKRFALPGVESTQFQIGEVRKPNPTQALVQCVLSDKSSAGGGKSEEICCLLREVDQQWRVSGIAAYSREPGRPPLILDFESPAAEPMGLPVSQPSQPAPNPAAGRPSPPRTAEDFSAPSRR